MKPWLIAMAGLPASGKSTLARRLATALPAAILDKDPIRAALFNPEDIEYSTVQDDFCMDLMLQTARYLLGKGRMVILDGRPFSRRYQVDTLARFASEHELPLKLIEAVCPDDVARQRIELDVSKGSHLAKNRSVEMYFKVKAQAEPIDRPHLTVDTSRPLDEIIAACLDYIHHNPEAIH